MSVCPVFDQRCSHGLWLRSMRLPHFAAVPCTDLPHRLRLSPMTGGEIVAAGKAAGAIGKKALGEDEGTKTVLLRIAEDTPEMRAAARSLAARTAAKERVKLKLYQPFARMLGVSKKYFEDTFPLEMGEKVADIPEGNLITPQASIAVPALQGLSYSFEEPSLKDLYLNLLATASDNRRVDQAHPAFAEIIKQLAPDEAKLLNAVLALPHITAARVKNIFEQPTDSFEILMTHLLPLTSKNTHKPKEVPQLPTWVDNWSRLGLVEARYDEFLTDEGAYDWVEERPEYIRLAARSGVKIGFDRGAIRVTAFGRQFFQAVS
jgi:hypothetical protein